MKKFITFIIATIILNGLPSISCGEENPEAANYRFLEGDYILIGKAVDSDKVYSGKVTFSMGKDCLDVRREIDGKVVQVEGKIEIPLCCDESRVLRIRFIQDGEDYEITYLWRGDLDNYARLSGYLYKVGEQTESPGLEALFIDHSRL